LRSERVKLRDIQSPKRWALNGGPFGSKLVQKDYVETGIPVIRGCNLPQGRKFSSDEFVFVSPQKADELLPNNAHAGDLVFTQRGTLGQVGIIPDGLLHEMRYVISQSQMKLTIDSSKADAHYIYYVFRAPDTVKQIHNHAFSSGVPHINLEILRGFEIDLPSLSTQQRIASILTAYDDLIEKNNRRIEILEDMAQMIYREWFVNFRFPGHEKVRKVGSVLGSIPATWEVKTLDQIMDFQGGSQPPKSQWIEEPRDGFVRMIQIRDYQSDSYRCYVKDSKSLRKCVEDDIMIARYGASVARICWGLEGAYNVALVRVVPVSRHFKEFLRSYLQSSDFQALLIGMSGRTAQAGFNKSNLKSIQLAIPRNPALLVAYEEVSAPLRQLILTLRKAAKIASNTRDFLLPKLISGEINVENLETEAIAQGI
jgi:type I restriction enzyme S subunit